MYNTINYLDLTEQHKEYLNLRIYEYFKELEMDKMPLTFKRYVIVNKQRKQSHLDLNTLRSSTPIMKESPTRRMKRGDTVEMYNIY